MSLMCSDCDNKVFAWRNTKLRQWFLNTPQVIIAGTVIPVLISNQFQKSICLIHVKSNAESSRWSFLHYFLPVFSNTPQVVIADTVIPVLIRDQFQTSMCLKGYLIRFLGLWFCGQLWIAWPSSHCPADSEGVIKL